MNLPNTQLYLYVAEEYRIYLESNTILFGVNTICPELPTGNREEAAMEVKQELQVLLLPPQVNTPMRAKRVTKKILAPDPVHGNRLVTRLVNRVMQRGKKSTAEKIIYK